MVKKTKSKFDFNKKIDFLFISYGGGHLKLLTPIAKSLKQNGHSICFFALTSAINEIKETGLPFFSYKDLPEASMQENISIGIQLARDAGISSLNNNPVSYEETVAYLGLNYIDLISLKGEAGAKKMWQAEGRQIFYPFFLMKKVISKINPMMVISTNSPRSEKAAIDAAFALKIKSICINDLFAIQESKWLKNKNFANKIFVLNKSVKKYLVEKGRPEKDIIVSGNPAFDDLLDKKLFIEAKKYRESFGWNQNINILYASTNEAKINVWTGEKGDTNLPRKIEESLRNYTKLNNGINLIIRRHPSQNQQVKIEERVFKSPQSQDINKVLHAVDIVIHSASTVGLQGGLIGKSIINIELSTIAKDLPLTKMGIGTSVFNLDRLHYVIDDLIKNPLSSNLNYKTKDSATEIIINEIYKLINA